MQKIIQRVVSFALASSVVIAPLAAQAQEASNSSGAGAVKSTNSSHRRPRVGLALGGGGSRGSGHVGVLKVLLEEGIPIDMIAGTSIGSVVGGFYASGMSVDEIAKAFKDDTFIKEFMPMNIVVRLLVEPIVFAPRLFGSHPYDGLYWGWKFRKYAQKVTGSKSIEQLSIPYSAVVTDVVSGRSVRLTSGDLGTAMQASTAVPGLKKPVQIGDRLYCDGGLINNVPVNHIKEMGADFVIAVDIDEMLKDVPIDKFRAAGSMSKQALRIQLAYSDLQSDAKADVSIHPDMTGVGLISRKKSDAQRGIDAGVAAARAALPEIKRKLAELGAISTAQTGSLK